MGLILLGLKEESTGLKKEIEDTINNLMTETVSPLSLDDLLKTFQNWHEDDKKELKDIKKELKQQVCYFGINSKFCCKLC